jgi:hypothetical protein
MEDSIVVFRTLFNEKKNRVDVDKFTESTLALG